MRSRDSSAGRSAIPTRQPTFRPPMCSSMPCAGGITRGRASASTCSTCRLRCGPPRNRWTPTSLPRVGAISTVAARRTEYLLELVGRRDLELVVAAVARLLVRAPPQEDRRVAEPRSLHVVVLDLADALDAERLPRKIFARAPPA